MKLLEKYKEARYMEGIPKLHIFQVMGVEDYSFWEGQISFPSNRYLKINSPLPSTEVDDIIKWAVKTIRLRRGPESEDAPVILDVSIFEPIESRIIMASEFVDGK